MRVAVKDVRDGIARERLLQPARSEKRVNLERLSLDGSLHRRIVHQRDQRARAQTRQRRFELERLVDRFAHELLDDRLAPRAEGVLAEAAAESLDAGDTDALHLARFPVENLETGVCENGADF